MGELASVRPLVFADPIHKHLNPAALRTRIPAPTKTALRILTLAILFAQAVGWIFMLVQDPQPMAASVGPLLKYQSLFGPILERILRGVITPILLSASVTPERTRSKLDQALFSLTCASVFIGACVVAAVIYRDW